MLIYAFKHPIVTVANFLPRHH